MANIFNRNQVISEILSFQIRPEFNYSEILSYNFKNSTKEYFLR